MPVESNAMDQTANDFDEGYSEASVIAEGDGTSSVAFSEVKGEALATCADELVGDLVSTAQEFFKEVPNSPDAENYEDDAEEDYVDDAEEDYADDAEENYEDDAEDDAEADEDQHECDAKDARHVGFVHHDMDSGLPDVLGEEVAGDAATHLLDLATADKDIAVLTVNSLPEMTAEVDCKELMRAVLTEAESDGSLARVLAVDSSEEFRLKSSKEEEDALRLFTRDLVLEASGDGRLDKALRDVEAERRLSPDYEEVASRLRQAVLPDLACGRLQATVESFFVSHPEVSEVVDSISLLNVLSSGDLHAALRHAFAEEKVHGEVDPTSSAASGAAPATVAAVSALVADAIAAGTAAVTQTPDQNILALSILSGAQVKPPAPSPIPWQPLKASAPTDFTVDREEFGHQLPAPQWAEHCAESSRRPRREASSQPPPGAGAHAAATLQPVPPPGPPPAEGALRPLRLRPEHRVGRAHQASPYALESQPLPPLSRSAASTSPRPPKSSPRQPSGHVPQRKGMDPHKLVPLPKLSKMESPRVQSVMALTSRVQSVMSDVQDGMPMPKSGAGYNKPFYSLYLKKPQGPPPPNGGATRRIRSNLPPMGREKRNVDGDVVMAPRNLLARSPLDLLYASAEPSWPAAMTAVAQSMCHDSWHTSPVDLVGVPTL